MYMWTHVYCVYIHIYKPSLKNPPLAYPEMITNRPTLEIHLQSQKFRYRNILVKKNFCEIAYDLLGGSCNLINALR